MASGGYGARLGVHAYVDGQTKEYTAEWTKKSDADRWSQPFSVTVPIPPNARGARFDIGITGSSSAGSRAVVIRGILTGPRRQRGGNRHAESGSQLDG